MELFAKILNSFQPLTIFVKNTIFDVRQGSKYAFEFIRHEQIYYLLQI